MIHRQDSEIWWSGKGVYYALNLDAFATQFGIWLRQFDDLLIALGYSSIYIELIIPILVLSPFFTNQVRLLCVLIMTSFHLGMAATMELGLFPTISIVSWIPFIPTCIWDKIKERINNHRDPEVKIYYDEDCEFCVKSALIIQTFFLLHYDVLHAAQNDSSILGKMKGAHSWIIVDSDGHYHSGYSGFLCIGSHSPIACYFVGLLSRRPIIGIGDYCYKIISSHRGTISGWFRFLKRRPLCIRQSLVGSLFCLIFFILSIVWTLRTVGFAKYVSFSPIELKRIAYVLRIDQGWKMFSPNPASNDGWFVIPAKLMNGGKVDIFSGGGPVVWKKPENVYAAFGNQRWRKYMMNLRKKGNKKYRLYYGRYMSRKWNRSHSKGERALRFKVCYMKEPTFKDRIGEPRKIVLWRHLCFKQKKKSKLGKK